MLATSGPGGKAPLPVSIGFLAVGIYWFAIRPFERRWMIRRQFSKRPDRDMEVEWLCDPDKIRAQSAFGHSELGWQAFAKLVQTPVGVMLYSNDQVYHWLPRGGFTSEAEFARFVQLAKSKVHRHYDLD